MALLLALCMLNVNVPIRQAQAHTIQTHGIATMLSLEYLKRRGVHDAEARRAYDWWREHLGDGDLTAPSGGLAALLARDRRARLALGFDPRGVLDAVVRGAWRGPGLDGGPARLPKGDGALLAHLTGAADHRPDVWGDVVQPLKRVQRRIENGPVALQSQRRRDAVPVAPQLTRTTPLDARCSRA